MSLVNEQRLWPWHTDVEAQALELHNFLVNTITRLLCLVHNALISFVHLMWNHQRLVLLLLTWGFAEEFPTRIWTLKWFVEDAPGVGFIRVDGGVLVEHLWIWVIILPLWESCFFFALNKWNENLCIQRKDESGSDRRFRKHFNVSAKAFTYLFADIESNSIPICVETLAFLLLRLPEQVEHTSDLTCWNTDTAI